MLYKAIPAPLAAILKHIQGLPLPDGTYLAGGTALAIYLGHRISVDVDLFTEKEFYCHPIISSLRGLYPVEVINLAEKDTLIANVNNVRFSLFKYAYPLLDTLYYNTDFNINLASPTDLAAMKVVALVQRGTARDFVDLKAIISAYNISLEYLIGQTQKKYGVSAGYGYQIKKSLVFFDDAVKSLGEVTMMKDNVAVRMTIEEWNKVEGFFKEFVVVG